MRNKRLDILRCIAVVAVILHHSYYSAFFLRVGWTGVDLFFVLSGFLIAGLLFSEYKKRKAIDFKRFFIRRGLKIYPAFYVFLLITGVIWQLYSHTHASATRYLHDIFFIMNYEHGVWDHTWTLAVEEHFYVFLPFFLWALMKWSTHREDPFRLIPWAAAGLGLLCLLLRAGSVYVGTPNFNMAYVGSHERMDALFFGVTIAYFYHFRPAVLEDLLRPRANRVSIGLASAILISFAYWYSRSDKFFATFGYTFVYLGFGGVLLLSLYVRGVFSGRVARLLERIGSAAAFVGMYSYSIYLWHAPAGAWLPGLLRRVTGFPTGANGRLLVYLAGSIAIGTAMSKLVEYPILYVRDRIFPAAQFVPVAAEVGVEPSPADDSERTAPAPLDAHTEGATD